MFFSDTRKGFGTINGNDSSTIPPGVSLGMTHTDDSGKTWHPQLFSEIDLLANLESIHASDTTHVIAVASNVIFRTHNGGRTWKHNMVVTNTNLLGIYFIDSLHGWACGRGSGRKDVIRTTDGGLTWQCHRIINDDIWFDLAKIVFFNRRDGLAFSEDPHFRKVYKTADSGKSWTFKYQLPGIGSVNRVVRFDNLHLAATTDNGRVIVSRDGAVSNQNKKR